MDPLTAYRTFTKKQLRALARKELSNYSYLDKAQLATLLFSDDHLTQMLAVCLNQLKRYNVPMPQKYKDYRKETHV